MYDTRRSSLKKAVTKNGWNPLGLIYKRSVGSIVFMIFHVPEFSSRHGLTLR